MLFTNGEILSLITWPLELLQLRCNSDLKGEKIILHTVDWCILYRKYFPLLGVISPISYLNWYYMIELESVNRAMVKKLPRGKVVFSWWHFSGCIITWRKEVFVLSSPIFMLSFMAVNVLIVISCHVSCYDESWVRPKRIQFPQENILYVYKVSSNLTSSVFLIPILCKHPCKYP